MDNVTALFRVILITYNSIWLKRKARRKMAIRLSRFKKLVDCLVRFNRISNMAIENEMKSKTGTRYEFKLHGWIGIFLIVIAEVAVI